ALSAQQRGVRQSDATTGFDRFWLLGPQLRAYPERAAGLRAGGLRGDLSQRAAARATAVAGNRGDDGLPPMARPYGPGWLHRRDAGGHPLSCGPRLPAGGKTRPL